MPSTWWQPLLDVQARARVVQVLLRADGDAADRVDGVDEAAEADLDVVVDVDSGVLLDRLHQQPRTAVGEGSVDLGGAVARDRHQRVAGDRQQQVRAGLPVCSSMIVSVRWPGALPVPSRLRCVASRFARLSEPTRR